MKNYQLFVGVDVSKLTLDAHILSVDKQRSEHGKFNNNKAGLKQLFKFIGKQTCFVCVEHTGVYAAPLCSYLDENDVDYTLVPALAIKKSLGIQRGKNDKADALAIARFALRFQDELETSRLPEEKLMKLQLLVSNRDRLIKAKNLLKVPAKEQAAFLNKEHVPQNNTAINAIKQEIKEADLAIQELIQTDEAFKRAYELSLTVPGVGPQIAVNMLITTRCFTCFDDARSYACYCGVAPFEYSSGTSIRGKSRVHPFANKKMKSLLTMGAVNAKRTDPELRLYFERKSAEGKNGMLVINAIRNKLIQRVFAVIKRGTPFIPLAKYAA